jgi:hypothetical protein
LSTTLSVARSVSVKYASMPVISDSTRPVVTSVMIDERVVDIRTLTRWVGEIRPPPPVSSKSSKFCSSTARRASGVPFAASMRSICTCASAVPSGVPPLTERDA